MFLLAKNTGTSSDMIGRFYGQVKLERMAKELRPEWRDRTPAHKELRIPTDHD